MKRCFNRAGILFLVLALLCAPMPAAWAEEWVMPELTEEIIAAEEYNDFIVLEEEVPVPEETLIEEAVMLPEEQLLPAAETPGTALPEEHTDRAEVISLDMRELDTGVSFYAELNNAGYLDFRLMLPENALDGEYRLTAADGQGGTVVTKNAAGQRLIDVFTNVRPNQLAYDMSLTLLHGGRSSFITVRDYLARCCEGLAEKIQKPVNKASCVGAITGVSDWYAGLVFDEDDTSLLLCFRAKNPAEMRFACDGHTVTNVKRENTGLWSVRVKGITVAELPADLIITAAMDRQAVRLSFSPFCYAAAHWSEDSAFILLCKALTAVMAQ